MGDRAHHREIVGDEEVAQAQLGLQLHQEVDDLRLHRHVEGGDRLVADHEAGFQRQGAGDHDALALAAGEFVREAVGAVARQADHLQQRAHAVVAIAPAVLAGDLHRLGDRAADAHARVERGMRILEDELQAAAHARQVGAALRTGDGLAEQAHRAGGGLVEADDDAAGGRLARAGFADKPQRFAGADLQGDAVQHLLHDRPPVGAARLEGHVDVAHRHDGAGRGGCRTHRGVSAVRVRGVQRTRWPSATATSSGGAALQTGSAWLQRGPKRQPAIASSGSGMRPGIE